MKYNTLFSIPYVDLPIAFWEKMALQYKSNIKDVYFPMEENVIGTGRPLQPNKFLKKFLESQVLPVSVLINPVVLQTPFEVVKDKLLKCIGKYMLVYNIKGITIANLSLAKEVKKYFPEIELTASTLMDISNEQQLVMIENVFDVLVPSSRVLRDRKKLQSLKAGFPGKIRILVNESCLSSCVYRTQHFFEMSNPEISHPCSLCNELLEQYPWLSLTGSWILPQHLVLIDGLYDELKLAGRVSLANPDRYFYVFSSYVNRTNLQPHEIGGGPASVNVPAIIDSDFYKITLECDKNCKRCFYCRDYWHKKIINHE